MTNLVIRHVTDLGQASVQTVQQAIPETSKGHVKVGVGVIFDQACHSYHVAKFICSR